MIHLFNRSVLFVALWTATGSSAQTTVEVGSATYSDGIHPTLTFLFEGTNVKYVEAWWQDELKKISGKVSYRKELVGNAALVPQVSKDTVRVLVKAEQRKGSPHTVAHVAILTTSGYVGPSSEQRVFDGAKDFVQQRSTALRRQLAQQELSTAEKGLALLNTQLRDLEREKERSVATIEKQKQKAAEMVLEQERSSRELDELAPRIDAQRSAQQQAPTDEHTKALNELLKEQTKANDRNRKALEGERSTTKKVEELTFAMQKNTEEQARMLTEIKRQEELAKDLRTKLDAIQ